MSQPNKNVHFFQKKTEKTEKNSLLLGWARDSRAKANKNVYFVSQTNKNVHFFQKKTEKNGVIFSKTINNKRKIKSIYKKKFLSLEKIFFFKIVCIKKIHSKYPKLLTKL